MFHGQIGGNKVTKIIWLSLLMCGLSFGGTEFATNTELQAEYPKIYGDGIYSTAERADSQRRLTAFKKEIATHGLLRLAERTEQAMGAIFKVAVVNLKRRGHYALARDVSYQWEERKGALIVLSLGMTTGRDIGDFEPLSKWLADVYDRIEGALGYELCRALRISDIKSLNHGIRVVFSPCGYGLSEFDMHFVHDSRYRGVFPVVVYWVSNLTCTIATWGAGFFLCSPISMLIELGADKYVGPWLAPKLYSWACD
jgi:hypothetical protein